MTGYRGGPGDADFGETAGERNGQRTRASRPRHLHAISQIKDTARSENDQPGRVIVTTINLMWKFPVLSLPEACVNAAPGITQASIQAKDAISAPFVTVRRGRGALVSKPLWMVPRPWSVRWIQWEHGLELVWGGPLRG